jgi:hypothetical protein
MAEPGMAGFEIPRNAGDNHFDAGTSKLKR